MTTSLTLSAAPSPDRAFTIILGVITTAWLLAVVAGATSGFFASLYSPLIAGIVAVTIILPVGWYFTSPRFQAWADALGHRPILAFHVWRVPAALLFFWYGAHGQLPPLFWILAGAGDLAAGLIAAFVLSRPPSARATFGFHVFGFLDLVVAVGTGLAYSLLLDPRMAPITVLPLALIPLFGVGISGASHIIAFDMLRRVTGFGPPGTVHGHRKPA
ncbi:MAG: permease [Hyphomicrobiaceae bacterium]|nr:permease [Hyphomicrobiaceae bacterium]